MFQHPASLDQIFAFRPLKTNLAVGNALLDLGGAMRL